MRSVLAFLLLAVGFSTAGCGQPNQPLPLDSGNDAARDTRDARVEDARAEDADIDEDASIDAAIGDSGPDDAAGADAQGDGGPDGSMPDGGADAGSDGNVSPACGDGVSNGSEECDGTDLDGADCVDQGFTGGTLGCTSACTFDTSACFDCGDGALDPGEECDGSMLGAATCISRGFDGGVLACSSSCSFDTSMCFRCGDGTIDPGEECDGSMLGGETCVSRGFDGGALGCSSSCTFATSMCFECGDGNVDPGEECDGSNLGGATCLSRPGGFTGGALACSSSCAYDTAGCTTCGNGIAETGEECDGADLRTETCASRPGFMSGALACAAGCMFDTSLCSALPSPSMAGQLVITEIMKDPGAFPDAEGEWFEVLNTSAGSLNLHGCRVRGTGGAGDVFTISTNLVIAPGAYATFAPPTMMSGPPGFEPSYRWARGFALANTGDGITIECGASTIDAVLYDGGATFPDPSGASMTLSPMSLDATLNDDGRRWCIGTSTIGATGDFGTPGAANDACETFPIGFCRLQFPPTIAGTPGGTTMVFGRVYAMGLSDRSTGTDPHVALLAEVGYGPDGSDPVTAPGWSWARAMPNMGYGPASPGYEVNNDEYQQALMHPAIGMYDYAYRFSGDRGLTWTYCDTVAGSSDGYTPAAAGQMTIAPPVTTDVLYFSEYVEGSGDNKALEIYNGGTAGVDLSTCAVRVYFNGSASVGGSVTLSGTLLPGATFVLCHTSAAISVTLCTARTTSVMGYNGDDALELFCSGATMDVIGQIGSDPGSEWGTGLASTANNTMRRTCSVTMGDPVGSDAFDPATQWSGFAVDTFDGLGMRGCP